MGKNHRAYKNDQVLPHAPLLKWFGVINLCFGWTVNGPICLLDCTFWMWVNHCSIRLWIRCLLLKQGTFAHFVKMRFKRTSDELNLARHKRKKPVPRWTWRAIINVHVCNIVVNVLLYISQPIKLSATISFKLKDLHLYICQHNRLLIWLSLLWRWFHTSVYMEASTCSFQAVNPFAHHPGTYSFSLSKLDVNTFIQMFWVEIMERCHSSETHTMV